MSNKEKIDIVKEKINLLDVSDASKGDIHAQFKKLTKIIDQLEFQVERTKTDKTISRNILDTTIEELTISNEKLIDQNHIIEQQIKFREVLLANVNHELRTPLNAIIGIGYLLKKTELNQQQIEYTDIIKRSADNLLIIINDFLTLSSINAGQLEFKEEVISIKQMLKDFSSIYKSTIDEKGIEFRISADVNLPHHFYGDMTRLNQIIQNVLNNAIKFTTEGSVSLFVKVLEKVDDICQLEFVIEDTGIGIPKHRQNEIFESFVQVKETKKDFMGTGLGLNIVKKLVQMMKGSIKLESEPNKGSKFSISLPLRIAESNAVINAATLDNEDDFEIPNAWKDLSFLMVEDNMANIIYAKELFKKWELNLTIAEDYTSGLDLATNQFFDIVLSDLKLPDGNGIELLKNLRSDTNAKCHNSIMFMVTASILDSDKEKAKSLNISGYIEKPFVPEKLLESISAVLADKEKLKPNHIIKKQNLKRLAEEHLNLIFNNDEKVKNEVLVIFKNQIIEESSKIEKGLSEKEYSKIGDAAHKLKSTARMIGINEFYVLLNEIEDATNNKVPFAELGGLITKLFDFKNNVLQELSPLFETATNQAA